MSIVTKTRFLCFLFSLQLSFFGQANTQADVISLDENTQQVLLNTHFSVYEQRSETMSIKDFRFNEAYLPLTQVNKINYGFVKNGIWLKTQINNGTVWKDWVLEIKFSQISRAELYVYDGNEQVTSLSDGYLNKTSNYNTPSFNLDLPINRVLDVYFYIEASSNNTIAPIYLVQSQLHNQQSMQQTLGWGVLYGTLVMFFFFAFFYALTNRSRALAIFAVHLVFILLWISFWSGQINSLPTELKQLFIQFGMTNTVFALCITSLLFTAFIIPNRQSHPKKLLLIIMVGSITSAVAIIFTFYELSKPTKFFTIVGMSIGIVGLCLWLIIYAFQQGFQTAKVMMVGWTILGFGALLSVFFLIETIESVYFNSKAHAICMLAQAGAFLYTIINKDQLELENEVSQARADAENNYLVIEEQNVHLNIARREALKASEVKSQFLANMSHEIRTPLNAIVGFSKELEHQKSPTEAEEYVKIINSAASDLLNLVNDILDFSKMEAGLLSLNERPFSPRELFEDVAATMSKTAHLKQLEFLYDVAKLPDSVIGDSFKIKQLITNLLSNALKFTNYGYVGLSARIVSSREESVDLKIEVFDSGIGIDSQDIDNIFKAFHQLDDDLNRSYQGTGLGLVICQELVYMMNGKLEVTSQPSVGSHFFITLPLKTADPLMDTIEPLNFESQKAIVFDSWYLSRKSISKQLLQANFDVFSYESLEFVKANLDKNTHLFITLPHKNFYSRAKLLTKLKNIQVASIVLLYSGATPTATKFKYQLDHTFIIRLPLTERKLAKLSFPSFRQGESALKTPLINFPHLNILAVDDMELNLRLLETWLKDTSINLDLAYDGKNAIAKCKQAEYDLILMDVQMPGIDGVSAARQIRNMEMNRGTPIIAVTAHAMSDEKQRFLKNGMDDFLSKPIRYNDLLDLIYQWCVTDKTTEEISQTSHELDPSDTQKAGKESINWQLAVERSNSNEKLALEFMDDFIAHLQPQKNALTELKSPQDNQALLSLIHKLHGACCYTGVPKLQELCAFFEERVKQDRFINTDNLLAEIMIEIDYLISDWKKRRKRSSL